MQAHTPGSCNAKSTRAPERCFSVDNLLVRIHFIIEMMWWTGLAPWEFEFSFPGSLTPIFQDQSANNFLAAELLDPHFSPTIDKMYQRKLYPINRHTRGGLCKVTSVILHGVVSPDPGLDDWCDFTRGFVLRGGPS